MEGVFLFMARLLYIGQDGKMKPTLNLFRVRLSIYMRVAPVALGL